MTTTELVFSILAALASICAIASFYYSRKGSNKKQIQEASHFEDMILNNQNQMMNSINELRLDIREGNKKQDSTNEKVIRLEEKVDSLDSRLKRIEERENS